MKVGIAHAAAMEMRPTAEQTTGRLLSVSTAAEKLGRSKWVIYGMIRRNRITYVRKGRRVFVDAEVVRAIAPAIEPEQPALTDESRLNEAGRLAPSQPPGTGQRELTIPCARPRVVFLVY